MGGRDRLHTQARRPGRAALALAAALATTMLVGPHAHAEAGSSVERSVGRQGKEECSQWDVTGTWQFKPYRGYTPTLTFAGHEPTPDRLGVLSLAGTITLPGGQWQNAGWTGPTNSFRGDLIADKITFLVTAPHRDGFVSLGKYTGTVTDGAIKGTSIDLNARDRGSTPWEATGSSKCIEFATDEASDTFIFDELGLRGPIARYDAFCVARQDLGDPQCLQDGEDADVYTSKFQEAYCPDGSCTDQSLDRYQQNVPNLIYAVTRLSLATDNGEPDGEPLFPSVRLLRPVMEKLSFISLQSKDKEAAEGAARTAWRLFSILATLDDKAYEESGDASSAAPTAVVRSAAFTNHTRRASGGQTASGDDSVSIGGVTLQPPKRWTVDDSEAGVLVLAEEPADVEAATPNGPRITVQAVGAKPSLDDVSDAAPDGALKGKVKVSKTKVLGERAVVVDYTITTGGTARATRVVAVTPVAGDAYSFTLEAPTKQLKRAQAAFRAVLASAEFDGDGGAVSTTA